MASMACCHHGCCTNAKPLSSPRWRRALWTALGINAGFFLAEIIAGAAAGLALSAISK
jgi:Co/Zn/Cd efflux system component